MQINSVKIINLITIKIFIFFSFTNLNSQEKKLKRSTYISLKNYKKYYNKPLTKIDSADFIFREFDTLVKIKNKESSNKVSVPYEYKDDTFLNIYKPIAFKKNKNKVNSMKYWKQPIKIFFSKTIKRKIRKKFMKFATYISKNVDSLNISSVKKLEDSNFIIYYSSGYHFEPRLYNTAETNFYIYWNNKNQIYKGAVQIDDENNFSEKLKLYQMKDYFIRSLGYFTLSDKLKCDSFFANCFSPNKKLKKIDLEILKYHYSYGICKGTSLKIFEEQHKEAKKIYKKSNHKIRFVHSN